MSKKELKLKICGMRDPRNIMDVAALNPDFMGFIFYEKSKRYVGVDFSIPEGFPVPIKKVGVFANEGIEEIVRQIIKHRLDFVQLHGDEPAEVCEQLKEKTKVIKVFRIDNNFDFEQTRQFNDTSDFFMFDTKSSEYGGSGKAFDWTVLRKYDQTTPFFLSGGLSIKNISDVDKLSHMNLYAIDVNSGVESDYGIKDTSKIVNLKSHIVNV